MAESTRHSSQALPIIVWQRLVLPPTADAKAFQFRKISCTNKALMQNTI
jgi:hypothetical protein